jgi:hypothetical protein
MTTLIRFDKTQLTPDFQSWEFYLAANPDQEFEIPNALILGSQVLREWVGFQVTISSTKRTKDPWGPHLEGKACDYITYDYIHGKPAPKKFSEILKEFRIECLNYIHGKGSELIDKLRSVGIDGFGIEPNCIHFDCNYKVGGRKDKYGNYRMFIFKCHYEKDKQGNTIMVVDENRAL